MNSTLFFESEQFHGTFECVTKSAQGLLLEEGCLLGQFESSEIKVSPFQKMVASWNAYTKEDTFIELWVRIKKNQAYSSWFSYGKWSDKGRNTGSFANQRDDLARLNLDVLSVLKSPATCIQFKVLLSRKKASSPSPLLRRIALSFYPEEAEEITPLLGENNAPLLVPPIAQLPVADIGNRICSPTSLAMVMAYYGHSQDLAQTCAGVLDHGTGIYGNWSYGVAYAGERGFRAFVSYASIPLLKAYLQKGIPLIASIKTVAKEELTPSEMPYPGGHLLVITGFFNEGNEEKIQVNDPATWNENTVARAYRLADFEKVFQHIIYVIMPET